MQEVVLGEMVCSKLKNIYFSNIPWIKCHQDVAIKFTNLKDAARKFYKEKTEIEMLTELSKFSREDIQDALGST